MDEQNQTHRLSLGQRFREVRERAGYTRGRIQEAADAIGISRAALDQFERDATYPKLETLHRMAQVYLCEMGDLLPRTETGYGREFEPLAAALMGIPPDAREAIIRNFAQTVRYVANSAVVAQRDVSPVSVRGVTEVTEGTNSEVQNLPSSAIPGVRTVNSVFLGQGIRGASDAQQQQQQRRRKHGNKKTGEPNDHGDEER